MITDEDYEKYIGIHMPNIRKLTLEFTEKTVNKLGQVVSMIHKSYEVFGLRIASDSMILGTDCVKEIIINVDFAIESTCDMCRFVLHANDFDKWNQAIDNNDVGDQKCSIVLIEFNKAKLRARSDHEAVYRSTRLVLNT